MREMDPMPIEMSLDCDTDLYEWIDWNKFNLAKIKFYQQSIPVGPVNEK